MSTRRSVSLATAVLGAAFVAWLVTVQRMEGMNGGPGTDLGALGWYVGVWVTMMAAMMLPAVLPVVLLFARVSSERMRRGQAAVGTPVFLAGYLGVWTAFGLVAYAITRLVVGQHFGFLEWGRGGRYFAAGAIGLAALYQLTPLKRVCLRHCRSPLALASSTGWSSPLPSWSAPGQRTMPAQQRPERSMSPKWPLSIRIATMPSQ